MSAVITVRLEGSADAGQSVAHHDGRVLFVTGGLPGERVEVAVDDADARILRGSVRRVLEASPHRIADRRELWAAPGEDLGGLEYAHVDDAHARTLKHEAVAEHFRRIAKLDPAEIMVAASARDPLEGDAGSATPEQWRTRVQFAVDARGRAAAHRPRSHDLVALRGLPLASPDIAALGLTELDYTGVDRVEVAVPAAGGPGAVVVRGRREAPAALVAALRERGLSVLESVAAPRRGSRRGGRNRGGAGAAPPRLRQGEWFLREEPRPGERFRVRADGFWQVHPAAPRLLTEAVRGVLGPAPGERIADLYSGAGLLSGGLAGAGAQVVGIEGSEAAVEDARANVPGASFVAGRVETQLRRLGAGLDSVVLDPPRAGAAREVTDAIAASGASRIAYVSCDSATLARDVARLGEGGFTPRSLEVFDLFPMTGHVEMVVGLER